MNQSFNIFGNKIMSQGSQALKRLLFALMVITTGVCVNAQLPSKIKNVYYITSAEDFKTLMSNQAYWAAGNTFIQLADIVFADDDVLTPIGNPTVPFKGVYDGRGHSLINGKMYWDSVDPIFSYGIFGYLHNTSAKPAIIKNLKIDNFTLTRATGNSLVHSSNDIKLGVLAGIIGEFTQISDISITNSRITDGGKNTTVKAIMVGGVVGDFYKSASQTTAEINSNTFIFRNIFADVDIDLQHTTKNIYDDPQMFVGGILGRIRTASELKFVPDNTIYTGTILAPGCCESPTVSNMRYDGENKFANIVGHYSGQYHDESTFISSLSDTEYNDFVRTRMFYDYKAYNSNKKATESVTADYPSLSENGPFAYKTRTFLSNYNQGNNTVKSPSVSATNLTQWAMVQGVNFGRCTDPKDDTSSDRQQMLDLLNSAVTETKENDDHTTSPLYEWAWDGTGQKFNLVSKADLAKDVHVYIEADPNSNNYTARINYSIIGIEHYLSGQGTVKWYTNTSATGEWTELIGENSFTIQANKTLFYRFTWTFGDVTITSDYKAPSRTIYVLNHESNNLFNNTFADNFHDGEVKFNYPPSEQYALAGDDRNDGSTPEKAVRTMKRAYELLDAYGEVKTNRIVVMGYYMDDDYLAVDQVAGDYAKPATITGTDNASISNGKISFSRLYYKNGTYVNTDLYLFFQAPIRLDNVEVFRHWTVDAYGNPSQVSDNGTYFICNYFDFTIDESVYFTNFPPIKSGTGLPGDIKSLPYINVVGGTQDCAKNAYTDPIKYANDIYEERPGYFTEPGLTTINMRSGVIGRMICCSRNRQSNGSPGFNITGSHLIPNRIRLNINIKNDIDLKNGIESTKYGYSLVKDTTTGKFKYVLAGYSHNLGLISGGQTDGTAYADVIMNIYAGHISRLITSNISYGRNVSATYPSDGFYGRTILNIYGNYDIDDKDVVTSETTLNEVFGGMLGRMTSEATTCKPYFYGKSVINMYGGYLGKYTGSRTDLDALKNTSPNLYGVGSGGVSGLGTELKHTTDPTIPYLKADGVTVQYGAFDAAKKMPVMTMYDGEEIDLAHTQCEVNLYSGFISGSVYGGGYGFSDNIPTTGVKFKLAPPDIGALYGDSKVTMYRHPDFQPPVVLGNIYGSGAGSKEFAKRFEDEFPNEKNRFLAVAAQYGNTQVIISDGTVGNPNADPDDPEQDIGGNVYAGSQGVQGYDDIAALYGSTNLIVEGGTIYGNIYGGSEIANIHKHKEIPNSGNTNVTINGGTIGNNIFGGSKGIDKDLMEDATEDAKAHIDGDTHVTINGGDFIGWPYIDLRAYVDNTKPTPKQLKPELNIVGNRDQYRTFNIYGGGYMNCDINGNANLKVYSSLLRYDESFCDPEENPNALDDPLIPVGETTFHKHYMDITYRNFCVYGGGFGEKTNVLNTDVYITIPSYRPHVTKPHGYTLQSFLDHQSFFDVCGGGYSGDVGHWVTGQYAKDKYGIEIDTPVNNIKNYNKTTDVFADFKQKVKDSNPGHDFTDDELQTEIVKLYDHYKEGNCKVVIDDYTFTRKVIGGGFYGSCRTTDTHVRCGSLRQVYGGSLLGYVHDRAFLQFGNRIEDFARWKPDPNDPTGETGEYVYSETEEYEPFKGDFENLRDHYPDVFRQASSFAKELNDYIFITEHIYGGNDVKGIIGTQFWEAPESTETDPIYGVDPTDGGPLFCTNVDISEEKGIVFNIYGGTFMGNVYSAGNGHYRGYFVPEWVRYNDGPTRMYRSVISSVKDENGKFKLGKAYRSRPMVGSVNINLRGNSEDDHITILGNFFGGGRECTIGQFNTILPLEDPRRLVAGGHLHVNMGGFTQIQGNVYLGAEGELYASQQCLPDPPINNEPVDLQTFNGSTTKELARLGNAAYDHWYFDTDKMCYLPGYPAPGKKDGNFGMYGEHMLSSYMQNVQIQGDVELTFYRFLYERDDKGCFTYREFADKSKNRIRRHWKPGEIAIDEYDAPSVVMNSFFLGGLSGSMTNNNVMKYTYPDTGDEEWGCIYRITIPKGVTVRDKVVMGSENATIDIYPYNEDFTDVVTEDSHGEPIKPIYSYEGGLITQHTFTYDLIALNDRYDRNEHYVENIDKDFYNPEGSDYSKDKDIRTSTNYPPDAEDKEDILFYRFDYQPTYVPDTDIIIPYLNEKVRNNGRYSLACAVLLDDIGLPRKDDQDKDIISAHIGPRDFRTPSALKGADENDLAVVTKLTLACKFDQLVAENAPDPEDHRFHYGGNVYGGCYNSGIVIGDVVLNLGSNLLGEHIDQSMEEAFNDYSSLKYNIGRVFGGGYGKKTTTQGDVYVHLLHNFRAMNVFGGGMMGDVEGRTHITYIGTEDESFVFGGIYGGGLQGSVGISGGTTKQATNIRLYSGNVERVFGGSCMGSLYGRAYVELCDQITTELDHLDYKRMGYEGWGASRLIAGKVFGGNDIAGYISIEESGFLDEEPGSGSEGSGSEGSGDGNSGNGSATPSTDQYIAEQFEGFSTCVWIHEEPNSEKSSPGSSQGYNGFPLIGDLYGGSNGNYGEHGEDGDYLSGSVIMATGVGADTEVVQLKGKFLPHIEKSHLLLQGGTVINAYGGGDMCTILDKGKITVEYPTEEGVKEARAGFESQEDLNRVWTVLHFSSDQQQNEVLKRDDDDHPIFKYQIQRLFGGNNNADMGIQPEWVLKSGNIGSLYSGANFGKMTFYQPYKAAEAAIGEEGDDDYVPAKPAVKECGLTLTIDSYDLTIDNVYGGGRLGDIDPDTTDDNGVSVKPSDDFYGATLNINRGIINHVYGGNDVSGYVMYGTNVNLRGAISGDVYCAGNGNYLYKYDRDGTIFGDEDGSYDSYFVQDEVDKTLYNLDTSSLKIKEDFSFETDQFNGARYFILPAKTDFGLEKGVKYNASDALTVMAINSYRPHIQRTKLYIEGQEDNKVWVRGNVYCGGNSASVFSDPDSEKPDSEKYDVKFDIGSHVILNGVFLGSNGYSLALGDMIKNTEKLNGINMIGPNDLEWEETTGSGTTKHIKNPIDKPAVPVYDEGKLYPTVLDLYMRAVETTETPQAFDEPIFSSNIEDSYIGEFCVGGNRGSMVTSKCIDLTFPSSITIFGRIIGGCKDADVTYNGVTHIGGLNKPLDEGQTKVDLKVKSKFRPLNLLFPDINSTPPISINNVIVDHDGNPWSGTGDKYYLNQQCNVYGGCFTSGTTVGDIKLDIFSDMLNYDAPSEVDVDPDDSTRGKKVNPEYIDKQAVINGVQDSRSWRAFTIVGGGYGAKTAVYGNINVRMLPEAIGSGSDRKVTHPSAATIFGGSQEGLVVGNTNVEIRDGKILANVYGASEAAKMYGSTSVIVGYPKYYKSLQTGVYRLNRADYMSETSRLDLKDEFDEVVVPKAVAYFKGDIIPDNVYDIINGRVKNARIYNVLGNADFRVGKNVLDKYVDKITDSESEADDTAYEMDPITRSEDETPRIYYKGHLFAPVVSSKLGDDDKPIADHIVPEDFGVTWDDITIWVGDQASNSDPNAPYYGQGNIYGGGYVPNTTDRTLLGQPTVMRYNKNYNRGYVSEFDGATQEKQDAAVALYGGNTAVLIWDDERNGKINESTGQYTYSESEIKDHINIGTGYFKPVDLEEGESIKGYFEKVDKTLTNSDNTTTTKEVYIYQTFGKVKKKDIEAGKKFYKKVADGGVYGGGRTVFAQAFRSIDLAYYGYAQSTPQYPKLLNTIQRADIATVTDCCMELVGASDFTINDPKDVYYAINRVGELRMISSLLPEFDLYEGVVNDSDGDGIRIHDKKRSRNYIALYNKTNHLGAFRSNWTFEQKYHLANGTVTTQDDPYNVGDSEYGYPAGGKESYVNRKHRFIDFYKGYAILQQKADTDQNFEKGDVDKVIDTYNKYIADGLIQDTPFTKKEDSKVTDGELGEYLESIGQRMRREFAKRNVGTSGNMIGISSGYELSFEGLSCQRGEDEETRYYGPAYGVTEMKLLTTVSDMGGGYVYALNHHYHQDIDNYIHENLTKGWCEDWGQDFLQTSGNFVFPGAAYNTSDDTENHNYIIDDCLDYRNVNHGYYQCDYHTRDIVRGRAVDPDHDINTSHEVHYWYVSGNTYTYNVTLTAFTSDDPFREFFYKGDDGIVNLFNVSPGTQIKVKSVDWFVHNKADLPEGVSPEDFSCDITHIKTETDAEDNVSKYFDKNYKIYLSLSEEPENELEEGSSEEDKDGAFVIRLPRYSYEAVDEAGNTGKIVNELTNIDDKYKNQNGIYDIREDDKGHRYVDPNYTLNAGNNKNFGYVGNVAKTGIKPQLGIRFVSEEPNRYADKGKEWSTDYYNKHLATDHLIQVVLETRSPAKNSTEDEPAYNDPITFVINIDLKYLMGPAVYGNIQIENCALPGEYIYVNSNDVELVMDPAMGVSKKSWRLYPNDEEGNPYDAAHYTITDPDIKTDSDGNLYYDLSTPEYAEGYYEENTVNNVTKKEYVITNENLVHIPAFYYQNGWNPVFTIRANGEDFKCSLPFYDKKKDEKTGKLVDDKTKPHPENRLQIHNYHRMKSVYTGNVTDNVKNLLFNEISYDEKGVPIYVAGEPIVLSKVIDLRPVAEVKKSNGETRLGPSRIYLENDDDMKYFFEYLFQMQNSTVPDGFKRFNITYKSDPSDPATGVEILSVNPMYCEGLNFYQQKNLTIPAKEYHHGYDAHIFKGLYHGNGNWMEIPEGAHINMVNRGYLFNTGFVSHVADENTIIYNDNKDGYIVNSFYFNKDEKGVLAQDGTLANCYQNTKLKNPGAFKFNELMQITTNGFRYGQVAYNLNGFYLQKRHKLLHEQYYKDGSTTPELRPDNNPYALNQRDIDIRGDDNLLYDEYFKKYSVKYIEDMFNNGDYRYALYYKPLESSDYLYKQFTEALRTAEEPNYFDNKGNRNNNVQVSMHNYEHTVDKARWCETHQLYHPIFDKDYLFFGEDLTVDIEEAEAENYLPVAYHPKNRVYRVGGFYGSAADKGYYMNRKAYLDTPLITAVDFVGYRDRDMYNESGELKGSGTYNGEVDWINKGDPKTYDYKGHLNYHGWVICKDWHEVFMPPTLDLPWTLDENNKPIHDFSEFDVNSNKVTHNLLIYTEDIKEANDVMAKFHYDKELNLTYGQTDEYSFATHSDATIRAHHIVDNITKGDGPTMSEGYFHLVDKHDFNAPVEFKTKRAWYNRMPQEFCYEFSKTNNNGDLEVYKGGWEGICLPFDVGKVYAASTDISVMRDMGEITHFFGDEWNSHEYWLRRLATSSPVSGQLCFERPTAVNLGFDANHVSNREETGDYIYKNTAIYDLYKDLNYDESNVKTQVNGKDYTHDLLYHFDKEDPAQSRKIENYRYLSRSMPYIVTFPGEDFYEFDLSGKFYSKQLKKHKTTEISAVPQTICYLAKEDADNQVTIHVTDEVPLISYTQEGYTMKGTFMHVTDNDNLAESVLYQKVENLAVLDGVKVSDNTEVHNGNEFVKYKNDMVVLPFRTYLVGSISSPSIIPIGSRSIIPNEEIEEEPEPELPETIDAEQEGIKVWVEGQKLVIKTPYDLTTTIFDMAGRPIRHIKAYEGTNRYSGLDQGFYIVLRTKFAIL